MTITIQQSMLDRGSLSDKSQLILELIPNGVQWVDLSTSQPEPNYTFQSEPELVSAVLDGLHNTRLLYVPALALFVDPEKLYAMTTVDLRTIVEATHDREIDAALAVCGDYDLQTNTQLKSIVQKLLSKCGVSTNSLFQLMNLADMFSLEELADETQKVVSASLLKEASNQALEMAQTPSEFADLVSFYIAVVDTLELVSEPAQIRQAKVSEVQVSLTPFAMEMLACPQISGSTSEEDINQAISTWLDYGNSIGFCSNARALQQLAQNLDLSDLHESVLAKEVADYTGKIQIFLRNTSVQKPILRQDGNQLTYPVESDNPTAQLSLDPLGCLTLDYATFH